MVMGKATTTPYGNWRKDVQGWKKKLTTKQKVGALNELYQHGKLALAAKAIGTGTPAIAEARKQDPEFNVAVEETLEIRRQMIVDRLETDFLEGHEHGIYNKDGEQVGTKTVFETQGRLAMIKRYEAEYKDKSEIDVKGGGGVLIVPAECQNVDEWVARQTSKEVAAPTGKPE